MKTKVIKKNTTKKTDTNFVKIRSRHPSHSVLRRKISTLYNVIFRLGSTTPTSEITKNPNVIEINTVEAVKNSANKLLMKQCFTEAGIKTADWWTFDNSNRFFNRTAGGHTAYDDLPYPIVTKHIYGSRGTGNTLIKSKAELEQWIKGKTLANYIFEKFYNYSREYRLHITSERCFYTCRKMLKEETPDDKRWFRNDSNSVWILEENENFDKPVNWSDIIKHSILALNAVGLTVGAVDVKVQSATTLNKLGKEVTRKEPEFIIIEINSAPSFGEVTATKYAEELPIIIEKLNK